MRCRGLEWQMSKSPLVMGRLPRGVQPNYAPGVLGGTFGGLWRLKFQRPHGEGGEGRGLTTFSLNTERLNKQA